MMQGRPPTLAVAMYGWLFTSWVLPLALGAVPAVLRYKTLNAPGRRVNPYFVFAVRCFGFTSTLHRHSISSDRSPRLIPSLHTYELLTLLRCTPLSNS